MSRDFRLVLGGILGLLGLVVVLQNQAAVEVDFLFWSVEAPLFFLLSVVLLLGAATGYLLGRTAGRAR